MTEERHEEMYQHYAELDRMAGRDLRAREERTRMKSYEYRAMTYNADVYCTEHLPVDPDQEEPDETGTAPAPVFADSEWDYYPTCAVCGIVHDYVSLTAEGEEHEYGRERREANDTTGKLDLLLDWGEITIAEYERRLRQIQTRS